MIESSIQSPKLHAVRGRKGEDHGFDIRIHGG